MENSSVDFEKLAKEATDYLDDNSYSRLRHLFHKWTKWQIDEKNNRQIRHCIICNRFEQSPLKKSCAHFWKVQESIQLTSDGSPTGVLFVNRCQRCGELSEHTVR